MGPGISDQDYDELSGPPWPQPQPWLSKDWWSARPPAEVVVTCRDCGLPIEETPERRDKQHDHCGPLPHTGPVGGPSCDRCR